MVSVIRYRAIFKIRFIECFLPGAIAMGALFGDRQLHLATALQLVLGLYWAAATGAIALLIIALCGGGGRWLRLRQVGYSARATQRCACVGWRTLRLNRRVPQLGQHGKTASTGSVAGFLTVPKQWFSHFYIAGLAWQLVLWALIVDAFWAPTRLAASGLFCVPSKLDPLNCGAATVPDATAVHCACPHFWLGF